VSGSVGGDGVFGIVFVDTGLDDLLVETDPLTFEGGGQLG
jgi:hypothetical protein